MIALSAFMPIPIQVEVMSARTDAATILVVDDDEVLSRVLTRVLSREGYTVVQATTVAEARIKAGEAKPSLALLDLCLPDGDGLELARDLLSMRADLPLVLITAYPLRLRDHPELTKQFRCVLTKPINIVELREAIRTALS
ncbi:MAG: response regulator, partial [Candidatus Acidiferrum sp.]